MYSVLLHLFSTFSSTRSNDTKMCVKRQIVFRENVENFVEYTSDGLLCVTKNNC